MRLDLSRGYASFLFCSDDGQLYVVDYWHTWNGIPNDDLSYVFAELARECLPQDRVSRAGADLYTGYDIFSSATVLR